MLTVSVKYWLHEPIEKGVAEMLADNSNGLRAEMDAEMSVSLSADRMAVNLSLSCTREQALQDALAHIGPLLVFLSHYGEAGYPISSDNVPAALKDMLAPLDTPLVCD